MGLEKTLFVKNERLLKANKFSSLSYFLNEIFANPTAFQSAAAHSCEL